MQEYGYIRGTLSGLNEEVMNIYSRIDSEISGIEQEITGLRRDFHKHPELGLQEVRTSGIIASYLDGLGLEVQRGVAETGVTGLLTGSAPGRTIMLRADMDGLPVMEKNDCPYRSINDGVMHACGHDGHMAILLGAAKVLSRLRDSFKGQVKFVFQPAEEKPGGARNMIEQGVLENPKVDAAFGLHLVTALPTGMTAVCKGIMMAAMDSFSLIIKGKGGHSAMPQGSIDAIQGACRVIDALHGLTTKDISSLDRTLVNIGTIRGGTAANVVADEVELTGTVRNLNPDKRKACPQVIKETAMQALLESGASGELIYEDGYPPVVNDPLMTDFLADVIRETAWGKHLIDMPPVMGSEDMSFYLERVPGCFFFLGAGNQERGLTNPLHSADFDFDEAALAIGASIFARLAVSFLR